MEPASRASATAHLPGGTQLNAPDYVTSNKMWAMGAAVERGELPREDLESAQRGACPTCGACQFMGSASTGQVLAEALGLALPGSALVPAPRSDRQDDRRSSSGADSSEWQFNKAIEKSLWDEIISLGWDAAQKFLTDYPT